MLALPGEDQVPAMKAIAVLCFFLVISGVFAADRVPKEMKPKLIREGKVLVDDKFDAAELDKKWTIPAGEFAGSVSIVSGTAVIESGTGGRQGALWQKLDPAVTDAGVQLLMKPFATDSMNIHFMDASAPDNRHWKLATHIYADGSVRVVMPDGKTNKLLKVVRTKLTKDDWWRVSVECKGDHYLVRVNGETIIDLKHDFAKGAKYGVMVNLYGGKAAIDEVKVMAGK